MTVPVPVPVLPAAETAWPVAVGAPTPDTITASPVAAAAASTRLINATTTDHWTSALH
jgi:hypothetical protein